MSIAVSTMIMLLAAIIPEQGWAGAFDLALEPGVQWFFWHEYDSTGRTVVNESGLRPTLAIHGAPRPTSRTGLQFDYAAQLYAGKVDYKGQTTAGEPLRTNTEYFGGLGDALLMKSVAQLPAIGSLSFTAGARLELWRRKILSGFTAGGELASGLTEEYRVVSGRAGLSSERRVGGRHTKASVGLNYPLSITEWVSGFDGTVKLHPGSEVAVSVQLAVEARPGRQRGSATVLLFYDSYRWARSSLRPASIAGRPVTVFQPRSHMDVVGVSLWLWM